MRRFFLALCLIIDALDFAFSNIFDFRVVEIRGRATSCIMLMRSCIIYVKTLISCSNNESTVTFSSSSLLIIDFFFRFLDSFLFLLLSPGYKHCFVWAARVGFDSLIFSFYQVYLSSEPYLMKLVFRRTPCTSHHILDVLDYLSHTFTIALNTVELLVNFSNCSLSLRVLVLNVV